jgi:hypothetical protein
MAALTVVVTGSCVDPPSAFAHGLVARADLPIPKWLFAWTAALVLVASFAALSLLWPRPRLASGTWRSFGGRAVSLALGPLGRALVGAVGAIVLAVVVWSGFEGSQVVVANVAPTFIYVTFWVGLVVASLVLGDVFRALNPWAAIARSLGWLAQRLSRRSMPAPLGYPRRLGRWPAAAGLLGFAYMELVSGNGDVPQNLAIAALIYSVVTLVGMSLYGVEPWLDNAEAFSVYFNLFSRISPLEKRGGRLGLRPPLSGLAQLDASLPGTVPLLAVMIGGVTFDGLSDAPLWIRLEQHLVHFLVTHGFSPGTATRLTASAGLLTAILFVYVLYQLGVAGIRHSGGELGAERVAAAFVHSLVPIAAAYVGAHYISFLLTQGQAIVPLASDPLGHGWNLFGTADLTVNYGIIGVTAIWYLQVCLVVIGHIAGLVTSHDCALVLYRGRTGLAVRSQYWMLGVMVSFTLAALLLLAQVEV